MWSWLSPCLSGRSAGLDGCLSFEIVQSCGVGGGPGPAYLFMLGSFLLCLKWCRTSLHSTTPSFLDRAKQCIKENEKKQRKSTSSVSDPQAPFKQKKKIHLELHKQEGRNLLISYTSTEFEDNLHSTSSRDVFLPDSGSKIHTHRDVRVKKTNVYGNKKAPADRSCICTDSSTVSFSLAHAK